MDSSSIEAEINEKANSKKFFIYSSDSKENALKNIKLVS